MYITLRYNPVSTAWPLDRSIGDPHTRYSPKCAAEVSDHFLEEKSDMTCLAVESEIDVVDYLDAG